MDEIRERLCVKVCKDKIRSCNVCFDRTYEGKSTWNMLGKQVDVLYEVKIGITVLILCRECLARLTHEIETVVQDGGTENG